MSTPLGALGDLASTPASPTVTGPSSQPHDQDATPKLKHKPFPSITGGCVCNTIRYRLLTSPLFCFACHCPDCQRMTGSAFGLFLNIEANYITVISPTSPVPRQVTKRLGLISQHVICPACETELWSNNTLGPAIVDVRVGTLDFPSLMEPDVHAFTESKLDWVGLPEGARTTLRQFDHKKVWPRSSLKRLEMAMDKWAKRVAGEARRLKAGGEDAAGDGEKTPTAVEFGDAEDDEAIEKRFKEMEKKLQERLEKLSEKLRDEDSGEQGELEELTKKMNIRDREAEAEKAKDGIISEPVN